MACRNQGHTTGMWIPCHAIRVRDDGGVDIMGEHAAHSNGRHNPMDLRDRLIHAATQYDIKQSTRPGFNRYALPQYMAAVDDAMSEIDRGVPVRKALEDNFNRPLLTALLKAARV